MFTDVKRRLSCLLVCLLVLSYSTIVWAVDPNSALVIIDMQPYFVTRGGNDKTDSNVDKINKILKNQINAIHAAEQAGIPIIFIEYENSGSTNEALLEQVKHYSKVVKFKKTSDGMFEDYNSGREELLKYLKDNKIKNLVITGANGGACVRSSIEGALSTDYNVVAFTGGIADFNYRDFIYPYSYQSSDNYPLRNRGTSSFVEESELTKIFPEFDSSKVYEPSCKHTGLISLPIIHDVLDILGVIGN